MQLLIGIDPGTHTGLALWDRSSRQFLAVKAVSIIEAMDEVLTCHQAATIELRFEDARQRRWFGNKGREALQGAGSIKRDCAIWEDFCRHYGIKFKAIPPQAGATKWDAATFKRLTGWPKRTNEHARDAGVLVFGG